MGVEVWTAAEPGRGRSWFTASVTRVNENDRSIVYVHYLEYDSQYDEIVEAVNVRPVNLSPSLTAGTFQKEEIPIPEGLAAKCAETESHNLFKENCGLVSVAINAKHSHLIVLGSEASINKAKLTCPTYFNLLQQRKNFQDFQLQAKNKMQQHQESGCSDTLNVGAANLGRCIG